MEVSIGLHKLNGTYVECEVRGRGGGFRQECRNGLS